MDGLNLPSISSSAVIHAPVIPKIEPGAGPAEDALIPRPQTLPKSHLQSQNFTSTLDLLSNIQNPPLTQSASSSFENRRASLFRSEYAPRLHGYDDATVLDPVSGAIVPVPEGNSFPAVTPLQQASDCYGISTFAPPSKRPKQKPLAISKTPQPQTLPQSHLQSQNFTSTRDLLPNLENLPSTQSASSSCEDRLASLFRSEYARQLCGYDDVTVLDPVSGAIVPVPEDNSFPAVTPLRQASDRYAISTSAPPSKRPKQKRSSELVRATNLGIEDEIKFRDIVKKTRFIYNFLRMFLMEEEKRQGVVPGTGGRADQRASTIMEQRGLLLNRDKRIVGSIPGIQIGDIFFYRMELFVVGLHGQTQAGIDSLAASCSSNGEPIATSVIVSGGYEDNEDGGDVIIYTGQGGQDKPGKQAKNQKLEGGNLALERSWHYGIEVRVIRGIKYENNVSSKVYVYDGLFKVSDCWFVGGKSGFGVYKYELKRIEGQPQMGSSVMRFAQTLRTKPLSVRTKGYLSFDISNKIEDAPVALYNDIDEDQEPLHYSYLKKTVFPPSLGGLGNSQISGCNCVTICSTDCICAVKNGGGFPYDHSGNLLRGRTVIFECGPSCQCPPNCRNRVTQRGLRHKLEVFKSQETGWGVRSLDIIHAGSFLCEYAGIALNRYQAEIMSMNGDILVYPSRFTAHLQEWADLSQVLIDYRIPTQPSMPSLDFAMDVSKMRNVACYINHSTAPNLMVQFVLYDHNHLMFPRIMLFSLENIPPLTELSLDYGVADEWNEKLPLCYH